MHKKASYLMDLFVSRNIDVGFINETYFESPSNLATSTVQASNYKIFPSLQYGRKKGIAIIVKDSIKVSSLVIPNSYSTFDVITSEVIDINKKRLSLVCLYRPPRIGALFNRFLDEFSSFLSSLVISNTRYIIAGDLNIPKNLPNDGRTIKWMDIIHEFNLGYLDITEPTFVSGNTLEWVLFDFGSSNDVKLLKRCRKSMALEYGITFLCCFLLMLIFMANMT